MKNKLTARISQALIKQIKQISEHMLRDTKLSSAVLLQQAKLNIFVSYKGPDPTLL